MSKTFEFNTQFTPHKRFYSNAGSPEKVLYTGHYNDDGSFDLIEKGKTNIYNEIQSHADSVDIHVILARYENGDVNALNQIQGSFGDFTGLPQNYAEMLNFLIDRKAEFMALSPETREKFGNDFNRYMATAGSTEWCANLGLFEKPVENVEKIVESEVVDNE